MNRKKIIILTILIFSIVFIFAEVKPEKKALLMATLWQQTSAEYRALAYQAFNIAKLRLDEDLQIQRSEKRAVIVDLDETVLDNSLYQARTIIEDETEILKFNEWVEMAAAEAIPGALEFLNYASEKGVDIFYISNRNLCYMEGTLKNVKKLGFPQAQEDHILLRENNYSNKEPRRQIVAENHYIVLIMGDNLIDFNDVFRKSSIKERFIEADKLKDEFGKKFIVLPNPIYGEWEKTLYGGTSKIPGEEKEKKRLENLKPFKTNYK